MKMFFNRGFSIVEISVVILIIGLLSVAVVSGKNIIGSSKRSAVISDFRKYSQAYDDFIEKYSIAPGDYIGTLTTPIIPVKPCHGNADASYRCAWWQLAAAGFIEGDFSPADNAAINFAPSGPYSDTVYIFRNYIVKDTNFGNAKAIILARKTAANVYNGSFMTSSDAYNIDLKIDDGLPISGKLFAFNDQDANAGCFTYNSSAYAASTYDSISDDDELCYLINYLAPPYVQ